MVVALAAAGVPGLQAQGAQLAECARLSRSAPSEESCYVLAGALVGALGERRLRDPSALPSVALRDLQPAIEGTSSAAGSLAQAEVVPSARPMAIGGGALSAVDSEGGSAAITALTFNPGVFYRSDRSGESVARNSRLADVTIYFPIGELGGGAEGGIGYFGLQARVNLTGLGAGSELWAAAEGLRTLTVIETRETERLELALRGMEASRIEACVERLGDGAATAASVSAACGADVRPDLDLPTYEEFRRSLVPLRERADSRYFGLDLRMDFGDPTLGAVPDAGALAINAGLAFGKQFVGAEPMAPSVGVRVRAGARYTRLEDLDESDLALDGGLGVVLRRPIDFDKAITASAGLELRFGGAEEALEEVARTDYLVMRAALSVPVTDQIGITVSFAQPLVGEGISRALSVSGDWRLLLPLMPVEP